MRFGFTPADTPSPAHHTACTFALLQYFGQVQYVDTYSVDFACQEANGLGWCNARILVEPHHKAYMANEIEKR
jgi:hypothetical protein